MLHKEHVRQFGKSLYELNNVSLNIPASSNPLASEDIDTISILRPNNEWIPNSFSFSSSISMRIQLEEFPEGDADCR